MREIFTLVVQNFNSENSMQGARLVNKGGKIGKKRNNQTSDREYEKSCIVSERNKSCFCFDISFIQSFNINFKVRSPKNGHCFASENSKSPKGAELSTETKELLRISQTCEL